MSGRPQVGWPRSNGRDLILILARHYIDAAAADGDGWMNLKAQAEAEAKIRASKIRAAQDSAACHANVECMIDAESIDFAEPVRLCPATIVRIGNSLAKSIEPAADAPPVVDAAPAKPPTVADMLRVLSAVEWRGSYGQWCQFSSSLVCRQWNGKRWSPWTTFVVSADDEASTARLVPASEADADPATRGPIDGSGGGA